MSKAKQQKAHAKHRCYQRYGIRLTSAMYTEWVRLIHSQAEGVKLVDIQSNRVRVYKVPLPEHDEGVYVVYDKTRKTIVTVLPKEYEPPERA